MSFTCQDAEAARLDAASDDLPPEIRSALDAHVDSCSSCREFAQGIDALEAGIGPALAALDSGAELQLPARGGRLLTLPRALALAAAVLVGAGLTWAALDRPAPTHTNGEGVSTTAEPRSFTLGDGIAVRLGPNSRARLNTRALDLAQGWVHCRVRPGSGPFHVATALGSVEVVGTDFTVALKESGEPMNTNQKTLALAGGTSAVLVVSVLTGAVLLRTPDQAREVRAGQVATASTAGAITIDELAALRSKAKQAERAGDLERELASTRAELADLKDQLIAAKTPGTAANPQPTKPAPPAPIATPRPNSKDAKVRELVQTFDWKGSLSALVVMLKGRDWSKLTVAQRSAISKFNLITTQLQKTLGVSSENGVFGDPRVAEVFLPAWIDAQGANLDDRQREQLRLRFRREAEQDLANPKPKPSSYVGKLAQNLRDSAGLLDVLGGVLRDDQMAGYLGTAGDDPFFGAGRLSHSVNASSTVSGLVSAVSERWTSTFKLDAAFSQAVDAQAREYVQASLAIPAVDRNLTGAARRKALLERTAKLLELQVANERRLAQTPGLSDAERKRIAAGSSRVLSVELKR